MEGVPLRMQGWVLLVLSLAFGAQVAGQQLGSIGLGGFLGAIAASLGASVVELRRPQLPRLVLFLPAFWLLVPGSLGLVGVTELAAGRESATDVALGLLGRRHRDLSRPARRLLRGPRPARAARGAAA